MVIQAKQQNRIVRILAGILFSATLFGAGYYAGIEKQRKSTRETAVFRFIDASSPKGASTDPSKLYDYYLSISNIEFFDRLAIEFVGDIYYCAKEYSSALMNYELALELVIDQNEPENETVALVQKIGALRDNLPDAQIFSERVVCG